METTNIANLSIDGLFTLFEFGNLTIRFRTSRHLMKYKDIKKWPLHLNSGQQFTDYKQHIMEYFLSNLVQHILKLKIALHFY